MHLWFKSSFVVRGDSLMQSVTGALPRLSFCMVGDDEFRARAELILHEANVDHEWLGRDRCMADAFRSSVCQDWPFVTDADFAQIDRHSNVLHFRSESYQANEASRTCRGMLCLGARLLEADGWAMKCMSSGIAHARESWLKLASQADQAYQRLVQEIGTPRDYLRDQCDFWKILWHTLVASPVQAYSVYSTCGMHILGQADLIVSEDELDDAVGDPDLRPNKAAELFEAFALRLLTEYRTVGFQGGQTYRIATDALHFRVVWEGHTGCDRDDLLHNPYGRLRLTQVVNQDSPNPFDGSYYLTGAEQRSR